MESRRGIARRHLAGVGEAAVWPALLVTSVVVARFASSTHGGDGTRDLDLVGVLVLAGMTVPLLWRRAAPTTVAVLSVGCCVVGTASGYPVGVAAFGAIAALCSYAYLSPRHRALAVGVPLGAALVAGAAVGAGDALVVTIIDDAVIVGLALLVGDLLHCREQQQILLRRRHAELDRLRAAETAHAVTGERMRIAREIHDAVGHGLVAIALQARAGRRRLSRAPERVAESLDQIDALAVRALDETRAAVASIRAEERHDDALTLEPQPTLAVLDALVDSVRAHDLEVTLRVDPAALDLARHVQMAGYRIVQESLSNAAKHARPAHVHVEVSTDGTQLAIQVIDDGAGTHDAAPAGSGLAGMQERAVQCGGQLSAGPRPQGGWGVRAALPASRLAG